LVLQAISDNHCTLCANLTLIHIARSGRTLDLKTLQNNGHIFDNPVALGYALGVDALNLHQNTVEWLMPNGPTFSAAMDMKFLPSERVQAYKRPAIRIDDGSYTEHFFSSQRKKRKFLCGQFIKEDLTKADVPLNPHLCVRNLATSLMSHRHACEVGIHCLTDLCCGTCPTSLAHTMAYLCVAKAIDETLLYSGEGDYLQDFFDVLSRWHP
jgi:hypothetical protein